MKKDTLELVALHFRRENMIYAILGFLAAFLGCTLPNMILKDCDPTWTTIATILSTSGPIILMIFYSISSKDPDRISRTQRIVMITTATLGTLSLIGGVTIVAILKS